MPGAGCFEVTMVALPLFGHRSRSVSFVVVEAHRVGFDAVSMRTETRQVAVVTACVRRVIRVQVKSRILLTTGAADAQVELTEALAGVAQG